MSHKAHPSTLSRPKAKNPAGAEFASTVVQETALFTQNGQEDTVDKPVVTRDEKGRFPAGVSGNPNGRVRGTKNKITLARLLLEEQLRDHLTKTGPKLMKTAVNMALKGNDRVMRVLLDKMLATPRGDDNDNAPDRDVKIVIQNLTGPKDAKPVIEGTVIRTPLPSPTKD